MPIEPVLNRQILSRQKSNVTLNEEVEQSKGARNLNSGTERRPSFGVKSFSEILAERNNPKSSPVRSRNSSSPNTQKRPRDEQHHPAEAEPPQKQQRLDEGSETFMTEKFDENEPNEFANESIYADDDIELDPEELAAAGVLWSKEATPLP